MSTAQHQIRFHGNAAEYFKIWIVNTLLTIVTLGIYSAWAKVRTRKYFYANTEMLDSRFDYHADPIAILKGRIIAFILLAAYLFSDLIVFGLSGAVFLIILLLLPFLVTRSLAFNARMTSLRGLRFNFSALVGEAYKVFAVNVLIVVLTLGIGMPWAMYRMYVFMAKNYEYADAKADFSAERANFILIYFTNIALMMAAGIGFAVFVFGGLPTEADPEQTAEQIDAMMLSMVPMILGFYLLVGAIAVRLRVQIMNWFWNGVVLKSDSGLANVQLRSNLGVMQMLWLYLSNLLLIVVTLGLATPWAAVRSWKVRCGALGADGEVDMDKFIAQAQSNTSALGDEVGEAFGFDVSV